MLYIKVYRTVSRFRLSYDFCSAVNELQAVMIDRLYATLIYNSKFVKPDFKTLNLFQTDTYFQPKIAFSVVTGAIVRVKR